MANYKIYGTNEPYSGMVVNIGNKLFTTTGGALEGNSYEVVEVTTTGGNQNTEEALPTMNPMNQLGEAPLPGQLVNPVTRLFQAPREPRYMRPDGTLIPIGSDLHEHQDGTIMTEHSMGDTDNSVVVTMVPSGGRGNGNVGSPNIPPVGRGNGNGDNGGMTTQTRTTTTRTSRNTGGNGGGTPRGGGGMGGY
tara:strand:+ start:103 stop:678 length:576 start_codon:yes stop_codon:yes gene_type:complete